MHHGCVCVIFPFFSATRCGSAEDEKGSWITDGRQRRKGTFGWSCFFCLFICFCCEPHVVLDDAHVAGSQDWWIEAVAAAVQESSGHGDVGTSKERWEDSHFGWHTHVLFQFFKSHYHCLLQKKAKIMSTSRAKARGMDCCQPTLRPRSLKIRTWQMLSRWKWGVMRFVQCERSCCQSSLRSVVQPLL